MANWVNEKAVPWAYYSGLFFSPIITAGSDSIVYVIDRGTTFYHYNLTTRVWTQLSSPTYVTGIGAGPGTIDRNLYLSPNESKLACVSDATNNHRGGKRIEIYTIATDTWAASAQIQNMVDELGVSQAQCVAGLAWADEDTIWCWASEATAGAKDYVRCVSYTISTNTFVPGTIKNGTLSFAAPTCGAINTAGTIVYGSQIGATAREWYKYTIATDTYASGGTLTAGRAFGLASDDDKLWYVNTTTYQQGYLATADDSENDDKFPENADRTAAYGANFGVSDAVDKIIAHSLDSTPWVMSADPTTTPTVVTRPMTEITPTTATGNALISDTGNASITEHGHCWATTANPTTANNKTTNGAGALGTFTSSLTSLIPSQQYYVRAYATNGQGTGYGANVVFRAGSPHAQRNRRSIYVKDSELRYIDSDGIERKLTGTVV